MSREVPYRGVWPVGRLAAACLLLACLIVSGCATLQSGDVETRLPRDLPRRMELAGLPFFAQEDFQCGPAALAMVMSGAGKDVKPGDLVPQVYLPGKQGSLQAEMLAAPRRHGFVSSRIAPHLEDLIREVAAGQPVLVLQNLGLSLIPQWHYSIVMGYDLDRGVLLLRSGLARREEISLGTFDRTWERSGRWAMLALAPGRMPATVDIDSFVAAVARLEKNDAIAANFAYQTVLKQAPTHFLALMGLGNTAYRARDLPSAATAFKAAIRARPNEGAAYNNLAQTQFELGRWQEALANAKEAVKLGGPSADTGKETLNMITFAIARQNIAKNPAVVPAPSR